MIPIILCGGSGTRLWPLLNQKAFYKLINSQSLLEMTLDRLEKFKPAFIVSVEGQKEQLEKILKNYKTAQVIYEPFAKNTAVSIALACFLLREKEKEIIGIFPADHYIGKKLKFQNLLAQGAKIAKKENKIVTFGCPPNYNSSSYGYIKIKAHDNLSGLSLNNFNNNKLKKSSVFKATAFIEKPKAEKAKQLLKNGSLWNSGIFISPVNLLIHHFEKYLPKIWNEIIGIKEQNIYRSDLSFSSYPSTPAKGRPHKTRRQKFPEKTSKFIEQLNSIYKKFKPISFDKGIMENINDYLCIPCDVGWTDLGSWERIAEWNQKFPGKLNNKAKTLEKNSKGNFVFSSEEKNFGLVGVQNQLIINSSEGLLIADKKQLYRSGFKFQYNSHPRESMPSWKHGGGNLQTKRENSNRISIKNINSISKEFYKQKNTEWIKKPWGAYRVLMEKELFKYKELKVNPKSQLSYQSHKKRSEHWIIREGLAEVLIEGKTKKLSPNEHIFIDRGVKHRLKNPTRQPLLVLEIQTGHCLEEDIVRYKDDYGRA